MQPDRWDTVSVWFNAWLAADAAGRQQLRVRLARDHPDLLAEMDALISASGELGGFLDTPALVLCARELAQEDPVLPAGSMIGPYRIVHLLARGGMGDVYRATDVRLHRDVAVKVLAHTKTFDPMRVARFMQEARVTAAIDHPNVVRVYDVGQVDERAYLIAELLEGETLRTRIERGALPAADVLRIALEITRGLAAAHAAGLVHRDLKPENIFLTTSGATKILDFGIAKLAQDESVRGGFSTLTGVVLGTAGYLAPEQIRGAHVDGRADLFALGVVIFEMLTGTHAFVREHLVETLHAILHDEPCGALAERHDVPGELADIVMRLLEKDPSARVQSASELIAILDPVARSTTASPKSRLWVRRRAGKPRSGRSVGFSPATTWATAAIAAVAVPLAVFLSSRAEAPSHKQLTLAVMPFESIASGDENDMLELGLADVFISRLGQLPDIRVLPLTATERLRGQDARQSAVRLGATHVLTVRLQRDGGHVRATPQLLSTGDGRVIWSTSVDSDASSMFAIQDIIVNRLVEELAPKLGVDVRSRLARPGTRNAAAYAAYLRGRVHVGRPTAVDLSRAAEYFEEASSLDPNYADAWAGLGSAYKRMPIVGAGVPGALQKAKAAARRALDTSPAHAEAISVLGTVAFWYDWDYAEAERLLRHALTLQPSSADTQVFLAHVLSNVGRHDEALEEIRRARSLDPAWPLPRPLEGQFLLMARRYDEALNTLDDVVEIAPELWQGHYFRVWTLVALRRYEEAIEGCDRVLELARASSETGLPHGGALGYKGHALARLGRREEAEAILEQLRGQGAPPNAEAYVLHALGRDDEALGRLREIVDRRHVYATFLGVDPMWDALREAPEYAELLGRANLLGVPRPPR